MKTSNPLWLPRFTKKGIEFEQLFGGRGKMEIDIEEIEIKNGYSNLEEIKEGIWTSKQTSMKVALTFLTLALPFPQLLLHLQSLSFAFTKYNQEIELIIAIIKTGE